MERVSMSPPKKKRQGAPDERLFKKGRKKTGGRKKGSTNRTTKLVKDAILRAGRLVGEDGNGKRQLTGYMCRLARQEPKAFATLLGKIIPIQHEGGEGGAIRIIISEEDEAV